MILFVSALFSGILLMPIIAFFAASTPERRSSLSGALMGLYITVMASLATTYMLYFAIANKAIVFGRFRQPSTHSMIYFSESPGLFIALFPFWIAAPAVFIAFGWLCFRSSYKSLQRP